MIKIRKIENYTIINQIYPYRKNNTWFFDDKSKEIVEEEFIFSTPKVIDKMLKLQGIESDRLSFVFSKNNFLTSQGYLQILKPENNGYWYEVKKYEFGDIKENIWLCSTTLIYFETFPIRIYFRVDKRL
jgi:hypothetical protein